MVKINGEYIVDRLIRVFMANEAKRILIICNDLTEDVSRHLRDIKDNGLDGKTIPLTLIVKSTPSSMHSFHELSKYLGDEPFTLTTVDTIFREGEFAAYVAALKQALADGYDGLMGLTDFIDDEKPLYVGVDSHMDITGFYDDNALECKYISGGIYGLDGRSISTLNACVERGESRMRNFQRALVKDGCRLKAYPFSKILDIDHATDIEKAEKFLNSAGK